MKPFRRLTIAHAALGLFTAAVLSGCAGYTAAPEPGDAAAAADRVVVSVEDETDKSYLSAVGDPSSLYRQIATDLAGVLTGGGVPASVFDAPGARALIIRLRRVTLDNASSGSELNVRLRTEYSAEIGDWRQPYDTQVTVQQTVPGGASTTLLRDLISSQIVNGVANDPALLTAAKK